MLESREAAILQTLKELPKNMVLIGGYAVNAYVPPRFSIDCDIVVFKEVEEIKRILVKNGFEEVERGVFPQGEYVKLMRSDKASFDLLVNSVLDRESGIIFEDILFRKYSRERFTLGRANPIRIKLKIADPEVLFTMKFVSARRQDIRDIFMLSGIELNRNLIIELLREKCSEKLVKERIILVKTRVTDRNYRASLQGAFGRIPDETFEKCKLNLIGFLNTL
ncbi:MAG: nucleotidyl transferase AbiEii/AbiGii toxin family protein [Thermoproteota archaeon]